MKTRLGESLKQTLSETRTSSRRRLSEYEVVRQKLNERKKKLTEQIAQLEKEKKKFEAEKTDFNKLSERMVMKSLENIGSEKGIKKAMQVQKVTRSSRLSEAIPRAERRLSRKPKKASRSLSSSRRSESEDKSKKLRTSSRLSSSRSLSKSRRSSENIKIPIPTIKIKNSSLKRSSRRY